MSNIDKAVSLTKYFVALPRTSVLLVVLFLLSIAFGFAMAVLSGISVVETLFTGIFVLAIPGFLTIILGKAMMPRVPSKRIAATALIGSFIYAITYAITLALPIFSIPIHGEVVFIGAAIVFILWYIIARIVFVHKWRSLVFAILQLLINAMFLITNGLLPIQGDPMNILLKFYIASFVLLGALYIFFMLINAPMKRTFGVASTDAVSMFFSQWFYGKKDMEEAFRKVGETVETYLSVFLFRRKDGDYAFVIPAVHYGPFGNLGGSNFSYLISQELEKRNKTHSLVFHGTATHDLNPVSSSELENIVGPCSQIISSAKPKDAKAALLESKTKDAKAEAIVFNGENAFIGFTRAPKTTEDISLGMGMAIMHYAEKKIPSATIVDQHNSEIGEIEYVEPGTKMGYDYLDAAESALSQKGKEKKLKVGFAFGGSDMPMVGPAGIKVAVIGTDPHYIIILVDSNGITPKFRERLMEKATSVFREHKWGDAVAAIYTTDTHKVNAVRGVSNPLEENEIAAEQVRALVKNAYEDMKEASFHGEKRRISLRVLGAKQAIEIISTINSIVAISKVAAPIIIISGIMAILWIMYRLG